MIKGAVHNTLLALLLAYVSPVFGENKARLKDLKGKDVGKVRIESEYTISVPQDLTEEVWSYLEERYGTGNLYLHEIDPSFMAHFAEESFTDIYFDTPDLKILELQGGIRHRTRIVDSDPTHKKSGRELIQVKLPRPGDLEQNRYEVKFNVKHFPKSQRLYRDASDAHPLIGLIDRPQREQFYRLLNTVNISPFELSEKVTLNQRRRRVYLSLANEPFATLTLDETEASKWLKKVSFTQIELELSETGYTEGDEEKREMMLEINDILREDLFKRFPDLVQDLTPKYNQTFNLLSEKFWFLPLSFRIGLPVGYLGVLLLALLGGYIFLRRKKTV